MTVHLNTQSATALERKAFLHWVMLFIKLYRNPVACLSGQSISRSPIMISTTPVCCYLVVFGDGLCFWTLWKVVWSIPHFSADLAHMVTVASKNKNTIQPTWTMMYILNMYFFNAPLPSNFFLLVVTSCVNHIKGKFATFYVAIFQSVLMVNVVNWSNKFLSACYILQRELKICCSSWIQRRHLTWQWRSWMQGRTTGCYFSLNVSASG